MSRIIYFSIVPVSWYLVIGLGGNLGGGVSFNIQVALSFLEKSFFFFFSSRLFIPHLLAVSLWVGHIICLPD